MDSHKSLGEIAYPEALSDLCVEFFLATEDTEALPARDEQVCTPDTWRPTPDARPLIPKISCPPFRLHYWMDDALSLGLMTEEQNRCIAETVARTSVFEVRGSSLWPSLFRKSAARTCLSRSAALLTNRPQGPRNYKTGQRQDWLTSSLRGGLMGR